VPYLLGLGCGNVHSDAAAGWIPHSPAADKSDHHRVSGEHFHEDAEASDRIAVAEPVRLGKDRELPAGLRPVAVSFVVDALPIRPSFRRRLGVSVSREGLLNKRHTDRHTHKTHKPPERTVLLL